jgi:hypothetical protein
MDGSSRASGDGGEGGEAGQGEEPGSVVEAEPEAELAGGGAEDATAEGRIEGSEAIELDGDGG